jgi:hypothetical protein
MEITQQFEELWPRGEVRVRQAWGMSEYVISTFFSFTIPSGLTFVIPEYFA